MSGLQALHYKVIENSKPESGDDWAHDLAWRGLARDGFQSIDAIFRPDVFEPTTARDSAHCVDGDCKLTPIPDLEYADVVVQLHGNLSIIRVIENGDRPARSDTIYWTRNR